MELSVSDICQNLSNKLSNQKVDLLLLAVSLVMILSNIGLLSYQYLFYPLFYIIIVASNDNTFKNNFVRIFFFSSLVVLFCRVESFISINSGSKVIFSQLKDDPLGAKTKIIFDNIKVRIASLADFNSKILNLKLLYKGFSYNQIQAYFDKHKSKLIITGSTNSLRLSFGELQRPADQIFSIPNYKKLSGLKLALQVPSIDLSIKLGKASEEFLAALILSLADDLNLDERINKLTRAASIKGVWDNKAHLSFANLMLGNSLMLKSIENSSIEVGFLYCARNAYQTARKQLKKVHHTALLYSLLHNSSLLDYVVGYLKGDRALLASSSKTIRLLAGSKRSPKEIADIARYNLNIIRGR